MPTQAIPRRPLAPCTVIALEVIAAAGSRNLRRADFELWMHQRGCDAREVARALTSLARRGWASLVGSSLSVTEAGHRAAMRGSIQPAASARRRRKPHARMPPGLL
ncbi:MAG: hypothetical protein KF889_28265 [Alphaproteobacteria bacterium]|nr:hypothetical protein [Alphaproteobacteria bacterium]MCW5743851.1 hypothetical protein [Alphaproteobacteria bacterium]